MPGRSGVTSFAEFRHCPRPSELGLCQKVKLPNQRMKLSWRGGRAKGKGVSWWRPPYHAAYARFVRPQSRRSLRLLHTITVAGSLLTSGCHTVPETESRGTLADVKLHLERLLKASDPHAFLLIELQGTPHFLQFAASAQGIEMDRSEE